MWFEDGESQSDQMCSSESTTIYALQAVSTNVKHFRGLHILLAYSEHKVETVSLLTYLDVFTYVLSWVSMSLAILSSSRNRENRNPIQTVHSSIPFQSYSHANS